VPESVTPPLQHSLWRQALVWAGVGMCVAGFITHRLWLALPWGRFGESLLLAGMAALLAWPLQRWRRWTWADALAWVWLVALVALTGAVPALAVLSIAAVAIAIGSLISGATRPLFALLIGLALLAGVLGWLLPVPIHRFWIYAPLCVLAIVLRRRALQDAVATMASSWRQAVDASPRAATWTVFVLGLASAGAWLPTMQHDDLAYHLGLPWQLLLHGEYALDPTHQVWALAPWAGDVLQALAQVLAQAEARSALNVVWLVAAAAALWQMTAAMGARPAMRWAAVAVYASLPMTAALLGGMQTETPATAVTLALAALIAAAANDAPRRLLIGALLFGLLLALKPLHGLAASPLLLWAAWRHRAHFAWTGWPVALSVAVLIAGSSYWYAWMISGNPTLPLFNGVFGSSYFATQDFRDARWQAGFGADVLWRLSFGTSRYNEGWDGGAGFALIALAGAWLLAFRDARTRGLAICASLAIVLPLLPLQYARYTHPGMALLIPAALAAMDRTLPTRIAGALVAALCLLNLAFQANSQWFLHTGAIKRTVAALGDDAALFKRYAPERLLAAAIRTRSTMHGAVLVMDAATPSYAELAGRGRTTAWYDPKAHAARLEADADHSGHAWSAWLRRQHLHELILRPAALSPAQRAALTRLGARRELRIDESEWWRIPAEAVR